MIEVAFFTVEIFWHENKLNQIKLEVISHEKISTALDHHYSNQILLSQIFKKQQ